jgi:hypothetical protein
VPATRRQLGEGLVAEGDEAALDRRVPLPSDVVGELVDGLEGPALGRERVGSSEEGVGGSHLGEATGGASGCRGDRRDRRDRGHHGGGRGGRGGGGGDRSGLQDGADGAADPAGRHEGSGVVGEERTGASQLPPPAVVAVVEEHAVTIARTVQ